MGIITAALYILKDITASVCIFTVMYYIFGQGPDIGRLKKYGAVFCLLFSLNAAFCIYFLHISPEDIRALLDFISHILQIIILYVFLNERRFFKSVIFATIILFSADMVYSLIVPYFSDDLLFESIVDIMIFGFASAGIYLFAKKNGENFLSSVLGEIPVFVYFILLIFELTCFYKEFGEAVSWYNVLYIISSLGIILTVFYMIFKVLFVSVQKNRIYSQMLAERDYSEKLMNSDEEIRRFRHDYKNHLIVLNSYLENGKTEEAKKYLEAMNEPVSRLMKKISSGNFAFDAILDYKMHIAAQKGIDIVFHGIVPSDGIRAEDICAVFSNLLDNAIEAVEVLSDGKTIRVDADIKNGWFILSIINPTNIPDGEKHVNLRTSKADKKNHGLGLGNVKRCIKKYNGNLSSYYSDGMYTCDVRIKV